MPQPENDEMFMTRGKMIQQIIVDLGGRAAEEMVFDDITTGASQDIKQATADRKGNDHKVWNVFQARSREL
jgi:cell division protease FtsH